MKAKTIKAALRKKLDAWLATIEDEDVRKLAKKNTIVTGGCIASMLLKEKINDIDVYFRDAETTFRVADYYVRKFKERASAGHPFSIYVAGEDEREELTLPPLSGRIQIVCKSAGLATDNSEAAQYDYFESRPPEAAGDYVSEVMDDVNDILDTHDDVTDAVQDAVSKEPYRPVFLSTNAITLTGSMQLILRFYGAPDEIHENYDFVHCTNYYDGGSGELVLRKEALEALLARELRYVGSKYPLCSIIRVRKFVARGWTINAGQILKMCMQLNALDLTNFKVLRDQLTGVDVAYFMQVVSALHEKDPEKVDTAYLIEIVDRMF